MSSLFFQCTQYCHHPGVNHGVHDRHHHGVGVFGVSVGVGHHHGVGVGS